MNSCQLWILWDQEPSGFKRSRLPHLYSVSMTSPAGRRERRCSFVPSLSFVKTNVCYLKLRSDLSETQKEGEQDKSGNPFYQLPRGEPSPNIEVIGYQLGPNLTCTFSGMHDTNYWLYTKLSGIIYSMRCLQGSMKQNERPMGQDFQKKTKGKPILTVSY